MIAKCVFCENSYEDKILFWGDKPVHRGCLRFVYQAKNVDILANPTTKKDCSTLPSKKRASKAVGKLTISSEQKKTLEIIDRYWKKLNRSPTVMELIKEMNLTKSKIMGYIYRLQKKGIIYNDYLGSLPSKVKVNYKIGYSEWRNLPILN